MKINKINKTKLLKSFKADLKASEPMHDDLQGKIEGWISAYNGEAYGNEQKGKSAIVSRDIKKQSEWQHSTIIDPFVSAVDIIKATPVTAEDVESARQNELVLNTQFCRQFNRYNFMTKAAKVLDMEGTAVIQCGWDYEDEEVEVEVPIIGRMPDGSEMILGTQTVMETRIITNKPTAVVCRNEDIYIDPTCMDDMDKCQFVIYRYETDMSTLRQDGRYKHLDKVAKGSLGENEVDFDSEDETEFRFEDDPRKKKVVYEYWGNYDVDGDGITEPIVCTWIDDVVIRLEDNPYPDGKPPFIVVPFNSVPFQMHGEANAEFIGDNQKIKTAITRGIIDNMAQSNNGQKGIRKGALDVANRRKFINGENFEFNGTPNDFWDGSYNSIPGSAFDMLGMMNNEIESITGVKSFSGGISGNSLGNMLDILTDIPMVDGSFKKLAHIVDGDTIVGSDGNGTKVLKAHDIKYPKIAYDMAFDNGSVIKSGGEHLWTVKVHGTSHKLRDWTTMDADEVYKHMQKGRRVTIPAMKEMRAGKSTGNSIDPYVLGVWLGDGMSHSARITTEDIEIVEYFKEVGYICVEVKDSSKTGKAKMYDVYKEGCTPSRNSETGQFESTGSLHSELRELGLHKRYGGEKHIPEEYFTATYEEKMELIRGLMDSDGYAHSGAFVQFAQSEGRLKDDVIRLIESLGLKASIIRRDKDAKNKQKMTLHEKTGCRLILATKDSYEIGFTPWSNPFKLPRKADKWKTPRRHTVALKSMSVTDKVLMRCLTVDSDDKLFAVTDKFTLTHNTATGARGALDATSTRRLNIVRNISENLVKPLMRKWMSYNAEFLDDIEVVRMTNNEFVEIRRDDLEGNIDIEITVSTNEDNAAKAQEITFMLQTQGQSMSEEMQYKMLAQWADLTKQPELAQEYRNWQPPQPTEAQMRMEAAAVMKAELENEKLKAEIADRYARAGENEIDAFAKEAKARKEMAAARKIDSEADRIDLDFLERDSGVAHARKMEEKEFDRMSKLDEKAFDAMYNKKEGSK